LPHRYPARALDEARVGALAVDQEELPSSSGGAEPLAFDVGGLACAGGPDDQPRPVLHLPGHDDQAVAVGPAEIAVDLDAEGDGAEVVVAHGCGPPDSRVHAPLRLALGALNFGGVDGLPAAGQVQCGGQEAGRDGEGELGPQERTGKGQVDHWGAELTQPARVAGEVLREGRPRPTLDHDHQRDGGDRCEGELPPAQPGDAQQCLADSPSEQGHGAEQEEADGHGHAQLAVSWRAAGGQAVAELVVVQRAAGVPPAPGWPMPAPPGVVGMPAAPAPWVLGMPAHAAPPRTGR
jgi:hypothetical protein